MDAATADARRAHPPLLRQALTLAGLLFVLFSLSFAPTALAGTRADRAATTAYLRAQLRFLDAARENVPQASAAVTGLVGDVTRECPQVLAGLARMPARARPSASELASVRMRASFQLELEATELRTWLAASAKDAQALIVATRPLHWSDAQLTREVRREVAAGQRELLAPLPDVCADARAWAASGFSTLPPSTAAVAAELNDEDTGDEASIKQLLVPYETAAARKLARAVAQASQQFSDASVHILDSTVLLGQALGLASEPFGRTPSTPIGSGRTAIGTGFTVSIENDEGSGESEQCSLALGINEGNTTRSTCVISEDIGVPELRCERGRLPLTLVTGENVSSVRLLLSDGRQIVSPVIALPTLDGRQRGYYFQVVRGPSPIPVSLTELDAEGRSLAVIKLRRLVGCTKHPVKLLAGGPVAHGTVPGGPSYTITAGRYSYLGQVERKVSIGWNEEGGGSAGFNNDFPPRRVALLWSSECTKHPATLFVALLPSAGDTLFARGSKGLTALPAVTLAATLHMGDKIAYGAFTKPPSELLVRDASGQQIFIAHPDHGQRGKQCTPGSSGVSGVIVGHAR
jgi:hypothetical protein